MKPAILTLIFCAYVAGWGWDSYDYDFTDYGYDDYLGSGDDYYDYDEYDLMDYGYSDYDYSDYGDSVDYYYDIFDVMEPKCRIKPWTRKHTCPKIYAGKCARDLLKKKKGKGKRRKELNQMKKKLREDWCQNPDALSNGKVARPCGRGLFQTAISSCDKGYKLIPKESKKRHCELNKRWSGKKPECKADCGMVAPIDNGKVTVSGTLQGSVAKYKCSLAFTLEGPKKRICQNDRNWSGQPPRCSLVPRCKQNYYNQSLSVLPIINPECRVNKGGCKPVRCIKRNNKECNRICRPEMRTETLTCPITINEETVNRTFSVDVVDRCRCKKRNRITISGRVIYRDEDGTVTGLENAMLTVPNYKKNTFTSAELGFFSMTLRLRKFITGEKPKRFPKRISIKARKKGYIYSIKHVTVDESSDVIQKVEIELFKSPPPITFNPKDGVTLGTTNAVSVIVPPGTVFKDSNGNPVSGHINAIFKFIDSASKEFAGSPGEFLTDSGGQLLSFGLFNLNFEDLGGSALTFDGKIDVEIGDPEVQGMSLYKLTDDGVWQLLRGGGKRRKRQAVGSRGIGSFGSKEVTHWINIDTAEVQKWCYAKLRVFENNTFTTEVTDGQRIFYPKFLLKVHVGNSSILGLNLKPAMTNSPSQNCYTVRCTDQANITGEIMFFERRPNRGDFITTPVPQSSPGVPSELVALDYKTDHSRVGLKFDSSTEGPLFDKEENCKVATVGKSLWFALRPDQSDNFGNDVCYIRMKLMLFTTSGISYFQSVSVSSFWSIKPGFASSVIDRSEMVSNDSSAAIFTAYTCARYECSKSNDNTTVVLSFAHANSNAIMNCNAIGNENGLEFQPPFITADGDGYFYGTDENKVSKTCTIQNPGMYALNVLCFATITPPANQPTTPPTNQSTTAPQNNQSTTTPPTNQSSTPSTNQSTTPPTNQSMTPPPTNQSTTPPTNQSTTPPTNQSTTAPPTNQSTTPSTNQSTTPPTNQSTTPPTNQSTTTPPTNQSTTPPTNQSTTPPTNQSTTPLTNHSTTPPPTNQSTTPPTNQSTTPPPANQSTTQRPTNQSSTPPTNQSTIPQPTNQSTISPPTNQPTIPPTNQSTTLPTNQSTTPPTNQSTTTPPANESTATTPTNQSTTPPTNQSTTPPSNQTTTTPPTNQSTTPPPTNQSTTPPTNQSNTTSPTNQSTTPPINQSTTPPSNQSTTTPQTNQSTAKTPTNQSTSSPTNQSTTASPTIQSTTPPPTNQSTTIPPANQSTTTSPTNQSTTPQINQSTTTPPTNQSTVTTTTNQSTTPPTNQSTTTPPANQSTTPPTNQSTTTTLTNQSSATTPTNQSTTPPTNQSTTPPPANQSTTPPPNNQSTTTPTNQSTTPPPTNQSTTPPPANQSTTPPPTNQSTTSPTNKSTTPTTNQSTTPPPTNQATTSPPTNQSTTPPTIQSTTPTPTNQSTTPPTNQSTTPPTANQSTTPQTTNQSTTPPTNQSTAPLPTNQSTTPPQTNQSSTSPPTNQSTTSPTNQSTTPPTNQSTTPPTNQSTTPPTNQSTKPSTNQPTTPPTNQ